ncbi:MAG: hypothetical protein ACK4SX_13330 [Alcanivoracaceae bacterium]
MMSQDAPVTVTADWSMVIQRVTQTGAEIWVGTLFPYMKMPDVARVVIEDGAGNRHHQTIDRHHWQRPFRNMSQRFYAVVHFTGLVPGQQYRVFFERRVEAVEGVWEHAWWQELRDGEFGTLPDRLPSPTELPFTVGLGSCFYSHRDGGQAAAAYRAVYEQGGRVSPDITFLSGDQVYLDIGFDSLSLIPKEIRERIASDYARHWQLLGSILTRGGTWMLPDDHEYWNDFPFYKSPIPALQALRLSHVRSAWKAAAKDAVANIQRSPVVETFAIGDELSFCLADLRSWRTGSRLLPDNDFDRLCQWAQGLTCPGVLVLPQPLIVETDPWEKNLRSYRHQYARLIAALGHSGHDIVLMSGDVHFGRIGSVPLGGRGGRLVEVISSPMSNLTGLNGLATATPSFKPEQFPDQDTARTIGWEPRPVAYREAGRAVSTRPGRIGSAYPRARTSEHFMTIGFARDGLGAVRLEANAWRVRERAGPDNMPVADFRQPFITRLR